MGERAFHVICACPGGRIERDLIEPGDFVIAADGGHAICAAADIEPDLFVGDYDSHDAVTPADVACERIDLPCAKDDTDAMAAIKLALERGAVRIVLHNALGGDVGHTLANLQGLLYACEHGVKAIACSGGQRAFVVVPGDGEVVVATTPGTRVSVFAFAGDAHGVTERGLRWGLEDATLEASFPLGVSNEAVADAVTFSVCDGVLLVVIG